jgi:peptide chain release factor 2
LRPFGGIFDPAQLSEDLDGLEKQLSSPELWDNPNKARTLNRRAASVRSNLTMLKDLETGIEDTETYLEMAREEGDQDLVREAEGTLKTLTLEIEKAELALFMRGKFDSHNALISIHPGAGGVDSCDWASMLLRMFRRWGEREGFQVKILDMQDAEAGIKSATIQMEGPYAYGYLRGEAGVHRLVRISPFDAQARRHTAFASVDVSPEVEEDTEIEVRQEDLRIDVYRSSTAGGQSVNTTDSAVRITHIPTNTVVTCQNERSQLANKGTAMKVLKSRLLQLKLQEQEDELAKERGHKRAIEWGSQIRSYVLQPYTQAKDHRTNLALTDVQKVLDGAMTPFIRAYLEQFGGTHNT